MTRHSERNPDAAGITHNGRAVPPPDWQIETVPGLGAEGESMQMVKVGDGWLPASFTMHLTLPAPNAAVVRVAYLANSDGVTILGIWAIGIDAVQAADVLRRVAPIEVWNRVAILDLAARFLATHYSMSDGGAAYLASAPPFSEDEWRELLEPFKPKGNVWRTSKGAAPTLPADGSTWNSAVEAWQELCERDGLTDAVREVPMRPRVRRNRVTKEHLAAVAATYRKAQDAGEPPTMAVAEAFHASHSTATRWVGLARKEKLLGAAQKGKAGEASQDESAR